MPYATGRCTVCLTVTLVYGGQTVGWIKKPLGTEVGLGPGDVALDADQSPHTKGHSSRPIFDPCLLCPNGRPSQQLLSSSCRLLPNQEHQSTEGNSSTGYNQRRSPTGPATEFLCKGLCTTGPALVKKAEDTEN